MADSANSTRLPAPHGPVTAAIRAMRSEPALTAADLNTTVNCEPRILDTTLGAHLGMAQPLNIRGVIEGATGELEGYGSIFTHRVKNPGRGRPGKAYYLTEGQALCICALSRAPNAPQVRRALIEAFMELRRQQVAETKVPSMVPVRAHRRRKPVPARVEVQPQLALPAPDATPGPFEPGSNLLLDLKSAVTSAVLRIQRGQATEFGQALLDVLNDRASMAAGGKPTGVVTDWNWKRTGQARAH